VSLTSRVSTPRVSVVIVAYGPDPWLARSVQAVLDSVGVDADVVLVDNGGTEGAADALASRPGVTLVRPGTNVGFATGVNLGVAASQADLVALVNPDALVEPDALAELVAVAQRPEVGLATASVRLADRPDRLNSAGNDIHFLGVSWSGHFDEPAADHDQPQAVTAASGAALAARRQVWDALGGLADELFAYYEDADLSLRCWQRGWEVVFVPSAVVVHRYEFSRNPVKYRLLERNRLTMVLTEFGPRHLALVAPALAGLELAMIGYAASDGWLGSKLAAYRWLWRHRGWIRARRRRIQAARVVPERDLVWLYAEHLQPGNLATPSALVPVDRVLRAYWRIVRRFI
jgi:GT2 family glycosyltransferase